LIFAVKKGHSSRAYQINNQVFDKQILFLD